MTFEIKSTSSITRSNVKRVWMDTIGIRTWRPGGLITDRLSVDDLFDMWCQSFGEDVEKIGFETTRTAAQKNRKQKRHSGAFDVSIMLQTLPNKPSVVIHHQTGLDEVTTHSMDESGTAGETDVAGGIQADDDDLVEVYERKECEYDSKIQRKRRPRDIARGYKNGFLTFISDMKIMVSAMVLVGTAYSWNLLRSILWRRR